jgi:hypothetical protein
MCLADLDWQAASAIAAAVSAIAAAIAARASRAAIQLAHRPFVYGEPAIKRGPGDWDEPDGPPYVAVRMHNDGPGIALEARFRIEYADRSWHGEAIPPARAMQSGEALPPMERDEMRYEVATPPELGKPFEVVTRYSDSAGRHWEVRNQRNPPGPLHGPIRLRSGWLDRWRPSRDW